MKLRILSAALAAALVPVLAQAQQAGPSSVEVHPVLGLMGTFGGDKLADVIYTDGTTSAVTAGGTAYLYAGASLRPGTLPLTLLGTVGYHTSVAGGDNGDIRFERVPFELLGMVDVIPDRLRIGGGLRYDTGVNLSSHGVVAAPATTFKDAAGGVVQVEWMLGRQFSVYGRYVGIHYRYSVDGGTSGRVDGSHGGIGINWYL
ncbi:MAG TPA: hypothetical protein VF457_05115 [Burkholderiaceae bacterium]